MPGKSGLARGVHESDQVICAPLRIVEGDVTSFPSWPNYNKRPKPEWRSIVCSVLSYQDYCARFICRGTTKAFDCKCARQHMHSALSNALGRHDVLYVLYVPEWIYILSQDLIAQYQNLVVTCLP